MVPKETEMLLWVFFSMTTSIFGQVSACPTPESILPCICTSRNEDRQIWCTHSDLIQVLKGVKNIGDYIQKPIDELIIENNYLPSLPGKIFQNVKILRLMLRHNGIERVSAAWLETQELNLVEIFIVENDLRNLPAESLTKLHNLQAITIQSYNLKRIPTLSNMPKLKYINIQSNSLNAINENTFENLSSLEKLFINGSPNLLDIKKNAFYSLPKLKRLEITNCGINIIHMRAFSVIPMLSELSLNNNRISDATMVGRATRDLPMLTYLNLNNNLIDKLNEGAFVDQPMLESILLANNNINVIHHGAFHRVPKLRVVNLNYNKIKQIHPESFLQQSGSGVEELYLIGNQIMYISEFRALLDALPRLKFLEMSENLLQDIPRGALRGHPSLERLHLNKNSIKFIQADAFVAMPTLRELQLSNNSLTDISEGPFWNLPALKGLDLSYNYFKRLQPKLLYNLPALRRINFSNNQISVVDPITFMDTPLLEHVNISGNSLVSIHPATFRNLANLYEVDASRNKLIEFVPGLPRGLEQLFVQKNQITSLPVPPSPDLDLPSLRTLDISSNGIQKIPYGSMKMLNNLRRFYMKRNGLRQVEMNTFNDLNKLEILDLSDNQILTIHPKSFTKLTNLKQLHLHGNIIESFDLVTIQDNNHLSGLDFSKNKLRILNSNTISKAVDAEVLNISSNSLNELPASLNMMSKLIVLDASSNHIKTFDGNSINNIHTLVEIKMPNNKIIELRPGSFKGLKSLETIDLDNNQIEVIHPKAIANLMNVVSIYLSSNHIIDLPDHVFSNLPKLRIVELQGNRIQFIALRAFQNIPLIQYLNLSNNQLTNIDNSGLKQLASLEVLDLSFNKLSKITKESFQYMEWMVELNLDNNFICYISGQPFNYMPRLKVLSLKYNKLSTVSEETFEKLRNNIAILDIDGNPLLCNCGLIWLKSWLSESSSVGPKCTDGTYVKGLPFSKSDCATFAVNEDFRSCIIHENEALLPNLASSQVFSSLDKMKDYTTQIKNNYQTDKVNNRPSPEESEYFYDEYVDYPYNETLIDGFNNEINLSNNSAIHDAIGQTPPIYAAINKTTSIQPPTVKPASSFTFFGMPIPPIDMSKLLSTGRKVDWLENKIPQHSNKYQLPEAPKFETGGFSPMLPTTSGGFMPIPDPTVNMTAVSNTEDNEKYINKGSVEENIRVTTTKPPTNTVLNTTTHQKTKSEIHEIQAYLDDDNSTHVAYNRIKNIEEQKSDPYNLSRYNLQESNISISQVTEKEVLITTDTTNDMSLQDWGETSTPAYTTSTISPIRTPMKKHVEQPTALSAIMIPSEADLIARNYSKRPATITKVSVPHVEQFNRDNYTPMSNREAKTRFSNIQFSNSNTRAQQVDGKDWYYKNYNKSDLDPYVAPGVHSSKCSIIGYNQLLFYFWIILRLI